MTAGTSSTTPRTGRSPRFGRVTASSATCTSFGSPTRTRPSSPSITGSTWICPRSAGRSKGRCGTASSRKSTSRRSACCSNGTATRRSVSRNRTRLRPPPSRAPRHPIYDYFHINSIEPEANGNFLVSARNTHTLYEIDRKTKKILWRLGGKKSDFKMGPGTNFEWQHDARRQADGTITMFDNGAAPPVEKFSRVLVLRVNTGRQEGDAGAQLPPSGPAARAVRGQRAVPAERKRLRRLGSAAVRQRALEDGCVALRRVLRRPQAAGQGCGHLSRVPLHVARTSDRPACGRRRRRRGLRELERRNRGRALAGAGRERARAR